MIEWIESIIASWFSKYKHKRQLCNIDYGCEWRMSTIEHPGHRVVQKGDVAPFVFNGPLF